MDWIYVACVTYHFDLLGCHIVMSSSRPNILFLEDRTKSSDLIMLKSVEIRNDQTGPTRPKRHDPLLDSKALSDSSELS